MELLALLFTYYLMIADHVTQFNEWKTKFNVDVVKYTKMHNIDEPTLFSNWAVNDFMIDDHNSNPNATYKLKHNHFSGVHTKDFAKYSRTLHNPNKVRSSDITCWNNNLPDSLDWRDQGAVTPVKNQGQCGSCWAFSTTGAIEGAYQIKTGELKSFSEQQLVSCDNKRNGGSDLGCNGGIMDSAFEYIDDNDGLCYEEDYKYTSGTTGKTGSCKKTCVEDSYSDVSRYVDVMPDSDEALMHALIEGPVSVAIQADQPKFQMYGSGVLPASDCGDKLDHGVLVVGWGTENNMKYWIVKNSWGPEWGDDGYIKLEKGVEGSGTCGLLTQPVYPIL